MNKSVVVLFCALAFAPAFAEVAADYVEGEKSAELISPDVGTAAAQMLGGDMAEKLLHAVRLQMVKYDRDMKSQSGRSAWHGKLIRTEIYTNELCKVEVYSNEVDGVVWRYRTPFKPVSVKSVNAKLPRPVMTNGIPAKLAAARLRRQAEIDQGVSNVTVTVKAGGER